MMLFLILPLKAQSELVISIDDPKGDDYGPSTYVYPKSKIYQKGQFDLLNFQVETKDKSIVFKVTFSKPFSSKLLKNIDIYIDKDHLMSSGISKALPGREANIAKRSFWDLAILISPFPDLAEKELNRIAPELSSRVIIPKSYKIFNDTIVFSLPVSDVGSPETTWGYLVLVTQADYESGDKISKTKISYVFDQPESLLIKRVENKPSEKNFGGGNPQSGSSNIIDMIVPFSQSQEKILKGYNAITRSKVMLPFIYFEEKDITKEAELYKNHYSLVASILAKDGKIITIDKGENDGMYLGRIGEVIDEYGDNVTDVIVTEVFESHSICKILKFAVLTYVEKRMTVKFK